MYIDIPSATQIISPGAVLLYTHIYLYIYIYIHSYACTYNQGAKLLCENIHFVNSA